MVTFIFTYKIILTHFFEATTSVPMLERMFLNRILTGYRRSKRQGQELIEKREIFDFVLGTPCQNHAAECLDLGLAQQISSAEYRNARGSLVFAQIMKTIQIVDKGKIRFIQINH